MEICEPFSVALGAFGNPQFSPATTRVYFNVPAFVTGGVAMVADRSSGKTKFLFYGGVLEVIRTARLNQTSAASRIYTNIRCTVLLVRASPRWR